MSTLHGKNLIGSERSAASESCFRARDPAEGVELDPTFLEATSAEIDRAAQLAAAAAPLYRRKTADERAAFLDRIAAEIESLGGELIDRARAETALPQPRLMGESIRTMNQLRMFAEIVREGSWVEASVDLPLPDRKPLPKPDLRRMLIPLGPVAVFGASNFPLAFSVAGGDTASALAAGCPVVVKAHPAHPGTSELVGEAILRAASATGMPDGVFSLLQGFSHEVGLAMVHHPAIQAVAFTGSLRGGRALFDAAAARPHPIPVYAEMGSTNPVFLLPGALRRRGEAIARGLQQSVTLGVGQFCTNPGLVLGLDGDPLQSFIGTLGERIVSTPPGTMLHEGIREAYEAGVTTLLAVSGVREVGRSRDDASGGRTRAGAVALSCDARTFLEHPDLSGEVFGPSTLVVRCPDRESLLGVARSLTGHLTATLHGEPEELRDFGDLLAILETRVGRLVFNGFPTGVEVCTSTQHGGPYPATTDSRSTSVGGAAIVRFARPICYQDFPPAALPVELRDVNERGIWRRIDGRFTSDDI